MSKAIRLLTPAQVIAKIVVSKRTFQRMIDDGRFPQPIRYSRKLVRWKESVVEEWMGKEVGK